MKRILLTVALCAGLPGAALAAVWGETVEYRHGDAVLEGYVATDDSHPGRRPGVLVFHEWKGMGEYTKRRADQLAERGYVAFAADMYGKGVRASSHQEAAKLAGIYKSDRQLMRARAQAALDALKAHGKVDPARIAAIGYCFGGTTVLEMARAGQPLAGVASFHGALSTPSPAAPDVIRCPVLVLHGGSDPHVGDDELAAFAKEMRQAGADWRAVIYGKAVHSFTVPEAGSDPAAGAAYDAAADKASWEELQRFLGRVFA
jgi:dienelactone hydrolase